MILPLRFRSFKTRFQARRMGIFLIVIFYIIALIYITSVTDKHNIPEDSFITSELKNLHKQNLSETSQNFITVSDNPRPKTRIVAAVLVLMCNRPSVQRTLDQLLNLRPDSKSFPIVVSQDCGIRGNLLANRTRRKYGRKLTYLTHPNYETVYSKLPGNVPNHMKGYYSIAAHYGWALNYTFNKLGFDAVIIVEDDLDIAPDFFEYFEATLPMLYADKSIWCVSAYNDNGKPELIDTESPELLYRTDFFPGLGWMLIKDVWMELSDKWPISFWDDWMRLPEQRKNRACIHPEISRSKTFGKMGTSNGQFFEIHLKTIHMNTEFVRFKSLDLTHLRKSVYDPAFMSQVKNSIFVTSVEEFVSSIHSLSESNTYKLTYKTEADFKHIASNIGLMDDFKSGIPRGGYQGIVPVMFKRRRLYIVPLKNKNDAII